MPKKSHCHWTVSALVVFFRSEAPEADFGPLMEPGGVALGH